MHNLPRERGEINTYKRRTTCMPYTPRWEKVHSTPSRTIGIINANMMIQFHLSFCNSNFVLPFQNLLHSNLNSAGCGTHKACFEYLITHRMCGDGRVQKVAGSIALPCTYLHVIPLESKSNGSFTTTSSMLHLQ